MDSETDIKKLRNQLKSLESEKNAIKKQYSALQQECNKLQNKIDSKQTKKSNSVSNEIWNQIFDTMNTDTDGIKQLIKNGVVTMDDTDEFGDTLFHRAVEYGIYLLQNHTTLSIQI